MRASWTSGVVLMAVTLTFGGVVQVHLQRVMGTTCMARPEQIQGAF